jgi:hypothetical protein
VKRVRRSELDLGVLTRGRYSSQELRSHRSDRCRLSDEFGLGECLGEFPVVLWCCCFEFGSFWSWGSQVCVLGLSGLD